MIFRLKTKEFITMLMGECLIEHMNIRSFKKTKNINIKKN